MKPNNSKFNVSVPYKITLLSNANLDGLAAVFVSVPYKITLLSNPVMILCGFSVCFSTL